ncbi:MAG: PaaI family thioesterase [SAR324 cluster bacterium]|nr:PaaI family thioesterase [SAR324 cluster bacterium]
MKEEGPRLDEALEGRIRAHFQSIPFLRTLGATLGTVRPGFCELRVPVQPHLLQEHGYVHGGVVGTLADSAAGYAARTVVPEGSGVITVEYKLNFLAPADGEELIGRAEVLKGGRTLTVLRSDVFAVREGAETRCASAIVTYLNLAPR